MLGILENQRKDVMEDQMRTFKQQFKPWAYISIISLPLLMWIYYYISCHGFANIVFPLWGKQLLTSHSFGLFSTEFTSTLSFPLELASLLERH
jgi:uncharacterized membrane protein (DUF106 family)